MNSTWDSMDLLQNNKESNVFLLRPNNLSCLWISDFRKNIVALLFIPNVKKEKHGIENDKEPINQEVQVPNPVCFGVALIEYWELIHPQPKI